MKQAPKITIPALTYYRLAISDPIGLRTRIFSEFGDIAWRKVRGVMIYYVYHPEHIKRILQDNQDAYFNKNRVLRDAFSPIMGLNSLFLSNDISQWYRDRMTANIIFEPKVYFQDYGNTITQLCGRMLDSWRHSYKDGQYINIVNEIDPLVVSILGQTIFTNIKIDSEYFVTLIGDIVETIKKKFQVPAFVWPFLSAKKEYEKIVNIGRKLTKDIVAERLNSNENWDDLVGYLIQEYKDSPRERIIELVSFQVASFIAVGYFTTSALLQWLLVELSYHPEVERKIEEEIRLVLGDRVPTYNDIGSLRYLSCVIKEVLRLHPTSFAMMRQTVAEDTLGGFYVPKGVGVILSTYHTHRHPDFWINPEGFDPERFRHDPLGQAHPYAYVPFGGGKRKCIGPLFSTVEATLITAMIIQRYRLHLAPHAVVKPKVTTLITQRCNVNMMRLQYK